jgi:hypothetical protein
MEIVFKVRGMIDRGEPGTCQEQRKENKKGKTFNDKEKPRLTGTSTALIAPAKVFDLSSLTQGDPELSMDLSTKV